MAGLVGCGGNTFRSISPTVEQAATPTAAASVPACVVNDADYILNEQMVDFEITDQNNVTFGISFLSGLLNAFGLSINTKSGQMTMYLHIASSLTPATSIADSQGQATMNSDNFSFNLGIWQIGINDSYFYQTPLSTLTANTLKNGLGNLRSAFNGKNPGWSSRVVYEDQGKGQYVIPAGQIAGVRVNDEFAFYNENYVWQGAPCASPLIAAVRTTTLPIATAVAVQVDSNSTVLQIESLNSDASIMMGAEVVPSNLPLAAGETSRTLASSVKIGSITSADIPITGGTSVSLATFLNEQTQTFLSSYSWYPVGNQSQTSTPTNSAN